MTDIDVQLDYLTWAQSRAGEIAGEMTGGESTGAIGNASVCGAPELAGAVNSLLDGVNHALHGGSDATSVVGENLGASARDYRVSDDNQSDNLLRVLPALSSHRAVS